MASIAFADSISDLGEVYTAEAVPGKTDSAPSEFHGLLGAGLFNFEKLSAKAAVEPCCCLSS